MPLSYHFHLLNLKLLKTRDSRIPFLKAVSNSFLPSDEKTRLDSQRGHLHSPVQRLRRIPVEGLGAAERSAVTAAAPEQKRAAEPDHVPRAAEGLCPLLRPQDVLGCTKGKDVTSLVLSIVCSG